MAETILAWADLDTSISRLTQLVFGLDQDAGSILIGNMDLKTKAEKIKLLYDHHENKKGAATLAKIINLMRTFSECRNIVAHRKVVGKMISQPTRLVFLSAKHVKYQPGLFEVLCVDHSELVASAKFARSASEKFYDMTVRFEDSIHNALNSQP